MIMNLIKAAKISLLIFFNVQIVVAQEAILKNLDFLFYQKISNNLSVDSKMQVGEYNGFYLEGENLEALCKSDLSKQDLQTFNEDVLLSYASTLQYHALLESSKALGRYAYLLGLAESDYGEFVNNLVGGYCSKNLTIISHKKLKEELTEAYHQEIKIPDVIKNPYFNPIAKKMIYQNTVSSKEFYYTTEVFKAFCSWGHDPYHLGLISDFLRSPALMAFSAREVSGLKLKWNLESKKVSLVQDPTRSKRVLCKNMFCRPSSVKDFVDYFSKINGSTQVRDAAARLYCSKLRTEDYGQAFYKNFKQDENGHKVTNKVIKLGQGLTDLDRRMMVSQLTALITKVPDFVLRLENKENIKQLLSSDLDDRWNNWATESLERSSANIFYEEPLVIEKINRKKYFNNLKENFKVEFDVNLGEIDRSVERIGKISLEFALKVPKNLMRFTRMKKRTYDPNLKTDLSSLENLVVAHIKKDLASYNEKFTNPLWNERMANLIADEILIQADAYAGNFFAQLKQEMVEIPIRLNFGPFALKYLYHKNQIRLNQENDKLLKVSND
jgi:hypothetical protein